jgi:WD40 repeat protein
VFKNIGITRLIKQNASELDLSYSKLLALITIFILFVSTWVTLSVSANPQLLFEAQQIQQIGRGNARAIDWHPNDNLIAVGGMLGIWIYDNDFADVAHLELSGNFNSSLAVSVAWSPDSKWLAAGFITDVNSIIQIWDAESFELVNSIENNLVINLPIAWSPDSRKIAVAAGVNTSDVLVWDITDTHHPLLTLEGHSVAVYDIQWSSNGSYILSSAEDSTVRLWDASTGIQIFNVHTSAPLISVAWSPDNRLFAFTDGQTIHIYNTTHLTKQATLQVHTNVITYLEWRGTHLIS